MTKREIAELVRLRFEVAVAKALRFTEAVESDIPPPTAWDAITTGWTSHAYQGVRAEKGWSTCGSHGDGWVRQRSGSQGARALYSTRLLALKAGRHELEMQYARKLAEVDEEIEREKTGSAEEAVSA